MIVLSFDGDRAAVLLIRVCVFYEFDICLAKQFAVLSFEVLRLIGQATNLSR